MATVTFKSTPVHTAGELPKVGTKAPKSNWSKAIFLLSKTMI